MLINEDTSADTLNGLVEEHRNLCVLSADFKVSGLHARLAEAYAVLAGIAAAKEKKLQSELAFLMHEINSTK